MAEFIAPSFLQRHSADEIYEKMKLTAGTGIDTSEASFFYDATYPVAIEKAEIIEQQITESLKLIYPQYAYKEYLDLHAELAQTRRRAATPSTTTLIITGTQGVTIDKGALFATASVGDSPSVVFKTTAAATIGAGGVTIPVECETAGIIGNVSANTITLMPKPITGVISVTNASAATGGTEEEDDDTLRERIIEIRNNAGGAGSPSDYKIWAKEVPGVGDATVIPEWQGVGTGTVKVVVVDSNGSPANTTIVQAVQNYIYPADKNGKAPIGAVVTVVAPTAKTINYSLTFTPNNSENIAAIKAAFLKLYKTVEAGGLLKYSAAYTAIGNIKTITDFSGLTMNGGTSNIQMTASEYPVTGTVNGQ